jgi:hypothetical protein
MNKETRLGIHNITVKAALKFGMEALFHDFFHARLLWHFIPSMQLSQLRTDKAERVQSEG